MGSLRQQKVKERGKEGFGKIVHVVNVKIIHHLERVGGGSRDGAGVERKGWG